MMSFAEKMKRSNELEVTDVLGRSRDKTVISRYVLVFKREMPVTTSVHYTPSLVFYP